MRLIIGVLGLLAILVGIRNAWRSHATAAPLTLGGVLIALALLLDPSVSEISGGYKDAQLKVVRGRFLNAAHLIRTAARLVADVEARAQLELIATEVEREPLSSVPRRGTPLQALARRFQRFIAGADLPDEAATDEPFASHELEDEEARAAYFEKFRSGYDWAKGRTDWGVPTPFAYMLIVETRPDEPLLRRINANPSWWGDWRLEVHARDPLGSASAQIFYGVGGMQQNTFHVSYPSDFPDAAQIQHPGEYVFTWRRVDEDRTVLARDTLVLTEEMLDPNVLDDRPEDMPGYKSRYWRGVVPVSPVTPEGEHETMIEVQRVEYPRGSPSKDEDKKPSTPI